MPRSRVLVIDFETTFYFHREGPGLLFGMGDPDETPGFDITVRWDFLPKVTESAIGACPPWLTPPSRTPGPGSTR